MTPFTIARVLATWIKEIVTAIREKNSFKLLFLALFGMIIAEGYIIFVQDRRNQSLYEKVANCDKMVLSVVQSARIHEDSIRNSFQARLDLQTEKQIKEQSDMIRNFNSLDSARRVAERRAKVAMAYGADASNSVYIMKRKSDSLERMMLKNKQNERTN